MRGLSIVRLRHLDDTNTLRSSPTAPKPQRTLSPEPVPSTQEEAVKPPSRPATPPPPPEPVPSTQEEPVKPPSRPATPPPPTFRDLRQELFRQVHVNVMNGGKFADVELSLYTRRTKTGGPYLPKVLGVSKRLLSAASEEFEKREFFLSSHLSSSEYACRDICKECRHRQRRVRK